MEPDPVRRAPCASRWQSLYRQVRTLPQIIPSRANREIRIGRDRRCEMLRERRNRVLPRSRLLRPSLAVCRRSAIPTVIRQTFNRPVQRSRRTKRSSCRSAPTDAPVKPVISHHRDGASRRREFRQLLRDPPGLRRCSGRLTAHCALRRIPRHIRRGLRLMALSSTRDLSECRSNCRIRPHYSSVSLTYRTRTPARRIRSTD